MAKVWYFGDFSKAPDGSIGIVIFQSPVSKPRSERFPYKKKEFLANQVNFNLVKSGMRHEGPTLILEISIGGIDIKELSFGFREISIHLSNYSVKEQEPSYLCSVAAQEQNIPAHAPRCFCPENQGWNENYICQDCVASNCDFCFDSNSSLCLSCSAG